MAVCQNHQPLPGGYAFIINCRYPALWRNIDTAGIMNDDFKVSARQRIDIERFEGGNISFFVYGVLEYLKCISSIHTQLGVKER